MAKTISLNFIAHEYQRVADIKLLNLNDVKIGGVVEGQKGQPPSIDKYLEDKNNKKRIEDYINYILLISLKKLDEMNNNSLYIGCSDVRKERGEKISVFMSSGEPNENSLINGIIGAATVTVENKRHNNMYISPETIKEIKVNIQFESRYDSVYRNKVNESDENINESDENLKDLDEELKDLDDNSNDNSNDTASHFIGNGSMEYPKTKSYFAAMLLTHGEIDNFNDSVYCSNNALFDFLLVDVLFRQIKEARPKGFFRTYRRFEGNDDRLKGTIDIARHIRLNAGQKNGKVAYSYRANTVNNYLNVLILKAFTYVKKKYPGLVNRKLDKETTVRDFFNALCYEVNEQEVSLQKAISNNLKPISHPYYKEYEAVRVTCLRILRNDSISIFDSTNGEVNGFLYYAPDLWEDYLKSCFDVCKGELAVSAQDSKKYIAKSNSDGYLFTSRPDFLCTSMPDFSFYNRNGEAMLILDAKLRPVWQYIISNESLFQRKYRKEFGLSEDIDKCIRDMVVLGTNSTGVVFPMDESWSQRKYIKELLRSEELEQYMGTIKRTFSKASETTYFYTLPHIIPKSIDFPSYNEWKKRFNIYRKLFIISMIRVIFAYAPNEELEIKGKKYFAEIVEIRENDPDAYQKWLEEEEAEK